MDINSCRATKQCELVFSLGACQCTCIPVSVCSLKLHQRPWQTTEQHAGRSLSISSFAPVKWPSEWDFSFELLHKSNQYLNMKPTAASQKNRERQSKRRSLPTINASAFLPIFFPLYYSNKQNPFIFVLDYKCVSFEETLSPPERWQDINQVKPAFSTSSSRWARCSATKSSQPGLMKMHSYCTPSHFVCYYDAFLYFCVSFNVM